MSRTALAFMSYVNEDDRHDNGWMTQFRERLSGEVRMHTGEPFDIFQDRKDIAWGQQWQERINDALDATLFLIPILTPAFFKSTACRKELERFLKREETLGRSDLILPVYYVNCPVLQDEAKREHDKLAQVIAKGQYADWRDLRFEEFTSPQCRKAFTKLAEQVAAALERSRKESIRAAAARQHSSTACKPIIACVLIGTALFVANDYHSEPDKPKTVFVNQLGGGDYATITEALKAVEPGSRILVRPGVYREGIVIDKPVEILGYGDRNEIVIEAADKDVILFQADNGRVANLTLQQTGGKGWYTVNITQGRLKLDDCDISSQSRSCIVIHGGANPLLRRNRIHKGKYVGVFVKENGQGTLEDNKIFANVQAGVVIKTSGNPTLRRNSITQNGSVGIFLDKCGDGTFEDNDLRSNTKGAWDIDPDCEANVQRSGNKE